MYLTDGTRLYEVVEVLSDPEAIVVEDAVDGCWSEHLIADVVAGKWRKIVPESRV